MQDDAQAPSSLGVAGARAAQKLPLTPAQKRVLDFLRARIRADGYAPTAQEIAAHFGWRARNAAVAHLRSLAQKGHIRLFHYRSRGIQVIGRASWFHGEQHSLSTAVQE